MRGTKTGIATMINSAEKPPAIFSNRQYFPIFKWSQSFATEEPHYG